MTFGDTILKLRRRLQDLRLSNATIITTANQNGVRYSSAQLIEIVNQAILNVGRLISFYPQSPLALQLGESYLTVDDTLSYTNGNISKPIANDALAVIAVSDNNSGIYTPIIPDDYRKYRVSGSSVVANGKFFVVMRNKNTKAKELYILPVPTGNLTISYTYIIKPTVYTSSEFATELLYQNIDDVILDIAELECRKREGNKLAVALLLDSIKLQLGISK